MRWPLRSCCTTTCISGRRADFIILGAVALTLFLFLSESGGGKATTINSEADVTNIPKYVLVLVGLKGGDQRVYKGYHPQTFSYPDYAWELTSPRNFPPVRVTVVEGMRMRDIAELLVRKGVIRHEEEFLSLSPSHPLLASALDWKYFSNPTSLEGFLAPDTYYFERNSSPELVAYVMLRNFSKKYKIKPLTWRGKRFSPYEVLITASLIEKETFLESEKPIIADIIYRRIIKHYPLQLCSTIEYLLPRPKRLLYKDLEVNSPYNTYKRLGFPPTPICSPGLSSVEAALHPQKNDYFFFVLSKDGSHHLFSKSFREHLKKKWENLSQNDDQSKK